MRDVLFRGKRIDNGEWVEGYLIRGCNYLNDVGMSAIVPLDSKLYPETKIVDFQFVDYKTVGQSTGKLDKHGTKIFEGDIVNAMMDYGPAGMIETVTCIYWDDDYGWQWNYFDMDTILVIGNIHDNPGTWLGLRGNRYNEGD